MYMTVYLSFVYNFTNLMDIDPHYSYLFLQVVSRESLAALQQEQAEKETNNQNPWTFQRIAQSNMLGVRKVLSPFDLHNHGRYTGKFFNPRRV